MIRYLVQRPIAVTMAFMALFILGVFSYLKIPVSLLPDIDIPEITVHISADNFSSRELENTVVAPLRRQLSQVGKLRDMRSQTRDGDAMIRLSFNFGTRVNLAYIEVNEKIDAAMMHIPRTVDRPRVVKASATDIPVFQLNLTPNDKSMDFLSMSEIAGQVLKRRVEQLPQVAMVDMTGHITKHVMIQPNMDLLKTIGITLSDIESALAANNVEPGSMTVNDGHYQYSVRFSSVMRTIEDMQQIYIRKNNRIYQLSDLATVSIQPAKEQGMAFFNGERAVILSVIKQADENMDNLTGAIAEEVEHFRNQYPDINFEMAKNQTELLDYTLSSLQKNLVLAFLFILIASAFFMNDLRSPLIIGISMFVSLVVSLLFFFLFNVSLNVVSLTGLILALGMMIDNSIIVTDTIGQHRKAGSSIDEACIKGTNEVITPMLSSVLTTISVFLPLVFLSGIAGAIFSDQAFSVAVGLLVSYGTGIILLPVMYKLIFQLKTPTFIKRTNNYLAQRGITPTRSATPVHEAVYHRIIAWIFNHKIITTITMMAVLPLCYLLFVIIPKEKMPRITQNEMVVTIDWNENITLQENSKRVLALLETISHFSEQQSALVGQQQFVLNNEQELSSTESEFYIKLTSEDKITEAQLQISDYINEHYPQTLVSFAPPSTIFEKIFNTAEAEIVAEYSLRSTDDTDRLTSLLNLENTIEQQTREAFVGIPLQQQLNLHFDREKMILYGVNFHTLERAIKTSIRENRFTVLRSYQHYLPVVMGQSDNEMNAILKTTLVEIPGDHHKNNEVPLSTFISVTVDKGIKSILASKNSEYTPFFFYRPQQPELLMNNLQHENRKTSQFDLSFSGTFFSNREMIQELMVVLLISVLLMYFILAAQFESFVQPLIVLLEIPIDIAAALGLLLLLGQSLNLMSAIGIVVTCGIIINDSILKVDIMNQLRRSGMALMDAIHEAGRRRLNAILMTSMTTIVCMLPLLFSADLGSELEKPLAIATIGGMLIGTPVSLFVVPLAYWFIFRKKSNVTSIQENT